MNPHEWGHTPSGTPCSFKTVWISIAGVEVSSPRAGLDPANRNDPPVMRENLPIRVAIGYPYGCWPFLGLFPILS